MKHRARVVANRVEQHQRRPGRLPVAALPVPQRGHRKAEPTSELALREAHSLAHRTYIEGRGRYLLETAARAAPTHQIFDFAREGTAGGVPFFIVCIRLIPRIM